MYEIFCVYMILDFLDLCLIVNLGVIICFYWYIWFNSFLSEDIREDKIIGLIFFLGKRIKI